MASFAIYNYQFFEVPVSEMQDMNQLYVQDARPYVMPFCKSFPKRQEIFGKFFEEDFKDGGRTIKFRGERQRGYEHLYVMKPTDGIIILKVINKHNLVFHERDLKRRSVEDHRACIVIIDNRPNIQRIAIEEKRSAFTDLKQVEKILTYTFSRLMRSYCMRVELENLHSEKDFWKHVNNKEKYPLGFWKLRITLPPLNLERLTKIHNSITKRYRQSFGTGMTIEWQAVSGDSVNLSEDDRLQSETIRFLTEDLGGNNTTLYPRGENRKPIVVGDGSYKYVNIPDSTFYTLTEESLNQQLFDANNALDSVKEVMQTSIKK